MLNALFLINNLKHTTEQTYLEWKMDVNKRWVTILLTNTVRRVRSRHRLRDSHSDAVRHHPECHSPRVLLAVLQCRHQVRVLRHLRIRILWQRHQLLPRRRSCWNRYARCVLMICGLTSCSRLTHCVLAARERIVRSVPLRCRFRLETSPK